MRKFLFTALLCVALGALHPAQAQDGEPETDCATTSLRHDTPSAWAGWSCGDVDDVIADAEKIKANARNQSEKWSDLLIAFVAVILGALSALLAQAGWRTVITLVDSFCKPIDPRRPDLLDSPFYLSQFRALAKDARVTQEKAIKLLALAVMVAGAGLTRAFLAVVFALAYMALLLG